MPDSPTFHLSPIAPTAKVAPLLPPSFLIRAIIEIQSRSIEHRPYGWRNDDGAVSQVRAESWRRWEKGFGCESCSAGGDEGLESRWRRDSLEVDLRRNSLSSVLRTHWNENAPCR